MPGKPGSAFVLSGPFFRRRIHRCGPEMPGGMAGVPESDSVGEINPVASRRRIRAKNPVEPKSLHGRAPFQLAFEFVLDDFAGLNQFRAGFAGFAKLLVGHGKDDAGSRRSRRNVFRVIQTPLTPVGGFDVIAVAIFY